MAIQSPSFSGIADYTKVRLKTYLGEGARDGNVPASALRSGLAVQRTLQPPADGFTITNADGVSGDPTFALSDDLAAVEGISTTGLALRSATDTWSTITYVAPTTFTPTIVGTTAAGAGTYSAQSGIYTRIGDVVTFAVTIIWSAHTGTGNMNVGGIPVTPNAGYAQIFAASAGSMTGATSPVLAWTGSVFNIRNAENNTAIAIDAAATFIASGSFIV